MCDSNRDMESGVAQWWPGRESHKAGQHGQRGADLGRCAEAARGSKGGVAVNWPVAAKGETMRRWRLWPIVRFINYRKSCPNSDSGCWTRWLRFDRYWSGRIWMLGIRHLCLELDWRRNWLQDMIDG